MVRVCFSLLLPLLLLGCATEQAQAPVNQPVQVNSAPATEPLSDCGRKNSVVDAWACATKDKTSP